MRAALSLLLAVGACCSACTEPEAEEFVVERAPVLTAEEQRADVVRTEGSPVDDLVEADVVAVVDGQDADACRRLDEAAAVQMEGTDFEDRLNQLGRTHPSAGAKLRAEITFVADLLGRCQDGEVISAPERDELQSIVDDWRGTLG